MLTNALSSAFLAFVLLPAMQAQICTASISQTTFAKTINFSFGSDRTQSIPVSIQGLFLFHSERYLGFRVLGNPRWIGIGGS